MFIQDIGTTLCRCADKLRATVRRDWFTLRKNPNFILEDQPESYVEKIKRATKLIFGESKRFVPLVGSKFTQEECVRLRQPDSENFQDPDEMSEDEDPTAAGDGKLLQSSPKKKASPRDVDVSTRTVTLEVRASLWLSRTILLQMCRTLQVRRGQPRALQSLCQRPPSTSGPTTWMIILPEYEYTMVINAEHRRSPRNSFPRCVAYELERVTAADARELVKKHQRGQEDFR